MSQIYTNSNNSNKSGKVFVGGLGNETTTETLSRYFEKYGALTDCVIMTDKNTNRSRGFGFITLSCPKKVEEILKNQPHFIDGKQVDCKIAIPKEYKEGNNYGYYKDYEEIKEPNCSASNTTHSEEESTLDNSSLNSSNGTPYVNRKIFVGGLHPALKHHEMQKYFEQFGEVEQCMIMFDKPTGKSRGFGFVIFEKEKSVDKVMQFKNRHIINGKWVDCKRAMPKEFMSHEVKKEKGREKKEKKEQSENMSRKKVREENIDLEKLSLKTPAINQNYVVNNFYINQPIPGNLFKSKFDMFANFDKNCFSPADSTVDNPHKYINHSYNNSCDSNNNNYAPSPSINSMRSPLNSPSNNNNEYSLFNNINYNHYANNITVYNYFYYKLFDFNGEDLSKMSRDVYENVNKVKLFKEEEPQRRETDSESLNRSAETDEGTNSSVSQKCNDCFGPFKSKNFLNKNTFERDIRNFKPY